MQTRTEHDTLGELLIPNDNYWGIHTARSVGNFPVSGYKVPQRLIRSLAMVKKACCLTNSELGFLSADIAVVINQACDEIISGSFSNQFPTDALQGGAGTSTNMNINEVIANRALEILGNTKGSYDIIHPIEHINLHQSTNDVYPTALKAALIFALRELSAEIASLQGALQQKEKEFADIVTLGRTELQDAVPITLGSQFASFAEAIARDRWRTFKCEERLRTVNIGGTAVGTGLTAPKSFIFNVIEKLRQETGLGLTRAEQVMDATANADVYVEVSGILAAHSANLRKTAFDLRLLHYLKEINLLPVQAGSSIMPGKINPVIMESVISSTIKISANDRIINDCAAQGTLQINEYLPLIAFAMLENMEMLINVNNMLKKHVEGITANPEICREHFEQNEIIITAFLPQLGYKKCEELLNEFHSSNHTNFRKFLESKIDSKLVNKVLSPGNLMSLGYKG